MGDIPPPPPCPPPPSEQAVPRPYTDIAYTPPRGAPGYVPPTGYSPVQTGAGIMSQFTGQALWSVILGVLSVGVPILTGLTSNGHIVYFYIIPIFGFIRGIQAVTRGQVIGGIVGIVLNA